MVEPVLVIEDDVAVREMVAEVLADEGLEVVTAADGLEALQVLRELKPRLVLLDLMMPRLDGAAFARAYRALPGPHAPIVLLTAYPSEVARRTAAEMGAAALLSKPFEIAELIRVIAAAAEQPARLRRRQPLRVPGKAIARSLTHPAVRRR